MHAVPESIRAWRWRIFAATWASYAGYYFCRKPFYITKGALGHEHGWDATTLANIGAIYLVTYMLGQFVAAWAGTRWGPRVVLLLGMAISAGCNLAFGATNSVVTFSAFMALNGLAQATGWSSCVGTMASWYGRTERGTVMGIWATNFQFGGIASNALAAWVAGQWGYRWSYFTGSALLMLAWAIVLLWQRDKPEDAGLPPLPDGGSVEGGDSDTGGWTPEILTNTLIIGVFYFFVKFVRYALWSWAPYVLEQSYHLAADEAGYLSTLFDVAGITGVVATGWLSDRFFGGRRVGISFLFIGAMCLATGALYALSETGTWAFAVCISLIGFCLFGPDTLMSGAAAVDVGSRRTAVAATGIINGMGSAGSVVQEFVFGALLAKGGMTAAFGTLVGSSGLATACLGLLLLRARAGKSKI
jgi:OPA family sugar phosphate sensor protein UhpC-like MFS transporter